MPYGSHSESGTLIGVGPGQGELRRSSSRRSSGRRELPHRAAPIGPGPPAGQTHPDGSHSSCVQIDGLRVYIRSALCNRTGPIRIEKPSAVPRRGVRDGRLNDNQIVAPRKTKAPTANE